MLRSMTAYGQQSATLAEGAWSREFVVTCSSVNRRYLDIEIDLPEGWEAFEIELRKSISEKITRGKVSLSIRLGRGQRGERHFVANIPLAQSLKEKLVSLKEALQVDDVEKEMFQYIVRFPEVIAEDATPSIPKDKVFEAVEAALLKAVKMKEEEGALIAKEFTLRLETLKEKLLTIQEKSKGVEARYFEKLENSVKKLTNACELADKARLIQECALLADKKDIAEEISRFLMHIDKFLSEMKGAGSGKVIEFILQEMLRETNTIGSKAEEGSIAHLVIEMKAEIEKLREQVQNVE